MDGHPAEVRVVGTTELIDFIHAFSLALERHYDWLWEVQRAVIYGPLHDVQVGACPLEAFFEDEENRGALEARVDPSALVLAHETVHEAASALLGHARAGTVPAATYDRFLAARKQFKSQAVAVERALWAQTCLLDSLTGLRNRHGMIMELREEQQRARRDGHSCVLAMMDIDHFKRINDRHGHAAGDAILREVTRATARRLRPYDRIYRYGGEEFLICLPETDVARGYAIIERVREEIAGAPVAVGSHRVPVTVSFGLAMVDTEAAVEESIHRADRALYQAKSGGRNRVITT
jgi:diguanylate cyclase (GGDEF)-like protein